MEEPPISLTETIVELRREIDVRRGAYPRWIQQGRLTAEVAARRIAILEKLRMTCEMELERRTQYTLLPHQPRKTSD